MFVLREFRCGFVPISWENGTNDMLNKLSLSAKLTLYSGLIVVLCLVVSIFFDGPNDGKYSSEFNS
mgnify:CR=1 FL=1